MGFLFRRTLRGTWPIEDRPYRGTGKVRPCGNAGTGVCWETISYKDWSGISYMPARSCSSPTGNRGSRFVWLQTYSKAMLLTIGAVRQERGAGVSRIVSGSPRRPLWMRRGTRQRTCGLSTVARFPRKDSEVCRQITFLVVLPCRSNTMDRALCNGAVRVRPVYRSCRRETNRNADSASNSPPTIGQRARKGTLSRTFTLCMWHWTMALRATLLAVSTAFAIWTLSEVVEGTWGGLSKHFASRVIGGTVSNGNTNRTACREEEIFYECVRFRPTSPRQYIARYMVL